MIPIFGGIASAISGALSSVLSVVKTLLPTILKIVGPALEKLGKAFESFFKELGLIEKGDKVEEIGDRALQAEQDELQPIKLEDFDSHEKYLKAIKEYEINPEKSALTTTDDKLHKALEILLGMAIAQYGKSMADFGAIVMNNPEFYSQFGRLVEFANLAKTDKQTFEEVINYMESKSMSTEKNDAAFDKLVEMEKKVNPDASDVEVWTAVGDMKK